MINAALLEPKPGGVLAAAARWLANRDRVVEHRGVLSLRDGRIWIGEHAVCERSAVEFAYITSDIHAGTLVRLWANRDIDLAVAEDDARDALEEIELGPADAVMAVDDLRIGADIIQAGGMRIAYPEIVSVRVVDAPFDDDVRLVELRDAKEFLVAEFRANFAIARDVAERIRHALVVRRRLKTRVDCGALDRNGRSDREWLAALRGLTGEGVDYRHASMTIDDLTAIVGDPNAPAIDRAAAAAAVFAANPEIVRRAASATADAGLHHALEEITRGNDSRLLAALGRLGGK